MRLKKILLIIIILVMVVTTFKMALAQITLNQELTGYKVKAQTNKERVLYEPVVINNNQACLTAKDDKTIIELECKTKECKEKLEIHYNYDNSLNVYDDDLIKLGETFTSLNKQCYTIPENTNWLKIGDYSVIIEGDASYNSSDTNITQETGYAHLEINDRELLLLHDFEREEATFKDKTNWSSDGTPSGGNYVSNGGQNNTGWYNFSDADDQISLVNDWNISAKTNYTVSSWIKPREDRAYDTIISFGSYDPAWYVYTGDTLMIWDSSGIQSNPSPTDFQDGNWHHVIFTRGGQGTYETVLYVDGYNFNNVTHAADLVNPSLALLGFDNFAGDDLHGGLDDVMFFNRSINDEEATQLYNSQFQNYKKSGTLVFNEVNLGSNNKANVTLDNCKDNDSTSIYLTINDGAKTQFNNCQVTNYSFNGSTQSNVTITLESDPFGYYSPEIEGNITINEWTESSDTIAIQLNSIQPLDSNNNLVTTGFISDNLEEIETVEINYTINISGTFDSWYLNFTANGTQGCSLGNLQSDTCYNFPNDTWINFVNGSLTSSFDGTQGQQGDYIVPTITDTSATQINLSIKIDEHYNPNVFKWYSSKYNFTNTKWQNGTNQQIHQDDLIKVNLSSLIPLDADQYKLDFRVTPVGNPVQPLEAWLCNSTYSTGTPDNNNCELVATKTPAELQDDGTKFRGVFTKNTIDTLGEIRSVIIKSGEQSPLRYYSIKSYAITNATYNEQWGYSNDDGATWNSATDNYESELNINWFYDGGVSPTETLFRLQAQTTGGVEATLENNITWGIDAINNYPPLITLLTPEDLNYTVKFPLNITWLENEPNNDEVNITASLYQNGVFVKDIFTGLNQSNMSYNWLDDGTKGTYNMTINACEIGTSELYCSNDTHEFNIPLLTNNVTFNIKDFGIEWVKLNWT